MGIVKEIEVNNTFSVQPITKDHIVFSESKTDLLLTGSHNKGCLP